MPSVALTEWTSDRMFRLAQVDAQCAAVLALIPPNPVLLDESLRGYAMLLSAHFQGHASHFDARRPPELADVMRWTRKFS